MLCCIGLSSNKLLNFAAKYLCNLKYSYEIVTEDSNTEWHTWYTTSRNFPLWNKTMLTNVKESGMENYEMRKNKSTQI